MAGFPVDPDDPLAPARGQSLEGLLRLLERLDGAEEAEVVRSALEAGVPRERVVDELQREVELLLDTERVALQDLFNMIRRYKLGSDVELHKRTLEWGLLSLIGPQTETFGLAAEHDNRRAEIAGQPVVLVRTDVGVDVFVPAESKA